MAFPPEQTFWTSLVDVNKFGGLVWKNKVSPTDIGLIDPRADSPERTILMAGGLKKEYILLDTRSVRTVGINNFELDTRESSSVDGLLRTMDLYKFKPQDAPNKSLLVGSLCQDGAMIFDTWLNRSLSGSNYLLDMVDPSIISCVLTREAIRINNRQKIHVFQKSIFELNGKYSLVLGDLLNTWMISEYGYPALDHESPYVVFEKYLSKISSLLVSGGHFFSRCVVFNGKIQQPAVVSSETIDKRVQEVLEVVPGLVPKLDRDVIGEKVERFFDPSSPVSFCGLEKFLPDYKPRKTWLSDRAWKVFDRLHRRYFNEVVPITMTDSVGMKYVTYACSRSKNE